MNPCCAVSFTGPFSPDGRGSQLDCDLSQISPYPRTLRSAALLQSVHGARRNAINVRNIRGTFLLISLTYGEREREGTLQSEKGSSHVRGDLSKALSSLCESTFFALPPYSNEGPLVAEEAAPRKDLSSLVEESEVLSGHFRHSPVRA